MKNSEKLLEYQWVITPSTGVQFFDSLTILVRNIGADARYSTVLDNKGYKTMKYMVKLSSENIDNFLEAIEESETAGKWDKGNREEYEASADAQFFDDLPYNSNVRWAGQFGAAIRFNRQRRRWLILRNVLIFNFGGVWQEFDRKI